MSIVEEGRVAVRKAVAVMERQLAGQEYLAGSFSLADICFMPYVEYLFMVRRGRPDQRAPNVAAWWTRVSERPSWQKVGGAAAAS
jgi:glutathione S-transferase